MEALKSFLIRAKKAAYASNGCRIDPTRPNPKDAVYEEENYRYHDSYLGSDPFIGEKTVYQNGKPVWGLNYIGRLLGTQVGYDFLKEALLQVSIEMPYRGPAEYQNGEYTYRCHVQGDFDWFFGYEEIFLKEQNSVSMNAVFMAEP